MAIPQRMITIPEMIILRECLRQILARLEEDGDGGGWAVEGFVVLLFTLVKECVSLGVAMLCTYSILKLCGERERERESVNKWTGLWSLLLLFFLTGSGLGTPSVLIKKGAQNKIQRVVLPRRYS